MLSVRILFFLTALTILPFYKSQAFTISVMDEKSGKPLSGALVTLESKEYYTNESGSLDLPLEAGNVLIVEYFGYLRERLVISGEFDGMILLYRNYQNLGIVILEENNYANIEYLDIPKQSARYAGGLNNVYDEIRSRFNNHPDKDLIEEDMNINVLFRVDEKGAISDMSILRADVQSQNIIREVMQGLEGWSPAQFNGRPVPQSFELQIRRKDGIYDLVEEPAYPKDGFEAFYDALEKEKKNPKDAVKYMVSGKVVVSFDVLKTGELTNFKIEESLGYGCDIEAIRVLTLAEPWVPAREQGQLVATRRELPVQFGGVAFFVKVDHKKKEKDYTVQDIINNYPYSRSLDLVDHDLDTISSNINQLKYLYKIDLENNNLTYLPETITSLPNLYELYVPFNDLVRLPSEMKDLRNLEILGLGYNEFDEFPVQLTRCKELRVLDLSGNKISALPPEIKDMKNLSLLYLGDNDLADLPEEIYKLKNLQEIHLVQNRFTEEKQLEIRSKFKKTKVFFD